MGSVRQEHFNEYLEYALEGRRRVKEQLNKRKPDEEFADLDFSYIEQDGTETFVTCKESENYHFLSKNKSATEDPKLEATEIDSSADEAAESIDLKSIIRNGESEIVEFKSTLRINTHTKAHDKGVEFSSLKTVAAFMNTEGGTLVIGLEDNGNPIGMEADKFPNEDKMSFASHQYRESSNGGTSAIEYEY